MQTLGYVALVVRDYDEAVAYFTQSLGFHVVEDSPSKDRQGGGQALGADRSCRVGRDKTTPG